MLGERLFDVEGALRMIAVLLSAVSMPIADPKTLVLRCEIYWADANALNKPDGKLDLTQPADDHKITLRVGEQTVQLMGVEPLINYDDGQWTGKLTNGQFVFKRRQSANGERNTGKMIIKPIQGGYAVAWVHHVSFGEHTGFISEARGRCSEIEQQSVEAIQ
jgi:hypothetical protein